MSAANRRILSRRLQRRLSRDSGVSSVKFALRVKILGELVRLLRVYKICTELASQKVTRALSAS